MISKIEKEIEAKINKVETKIKWRESHWGYGESSIFDLCEQQKGLKQALRILRKHTYARI